VNYVSWGDAARFANWLHNGQRTGVQDSTTTEDGAYRLQGATSRKALMAVIREANWKWSIPSEDEWYKAAYHKNDGDTNNYFDFPTSSDIAPGYVNNIGKLSGTGTTFVEGEVAPSNYASYDGDEGTDAGGKPYYRTQAGEWKKSSSPYNTFDQGGNVWEGNEADIKSSRGLRGGAVDDEAGDLRASFRYFYPPTIEIPYIGFRVVTVPDKAK
jgi:formylglycine-generating enzyme required for sulfatase activity